MEDDEKLVLELAEAMTVTPCTVSDDLRDRLAQRFSEKQQVELAHTISWENARARFNRAFDITADGYQGSATT